MALRHNTSRGGIGGVCLLGFVQEEHAEGLRHPERQTNVKLGNLRWLSSTSIVEAGSSEDAAERALG